MNALAVAVIVLHPVLEQPGDLRLLAVGTGVDLVEWHVDGKLVAVTRDSEATAVPVGSGEHQVVARTRHAGPWEALARPEPESPGVHVVPAWTGRSDATWARSPDGLGAPTVLALAGGIGGLALARRWRS